MNTGMQEMQMSMGDIAANLYDGGWRAADREQMIEREWTFGDCRVAKYSWGFCVWASGGHCDVVPGNGDDMDACEAALDNGESPIASGWEDGAGHDVAAECERTAREEHGITDREE